MASLCMRFSWGLREDILELRRLVESSGKSIGGLEKSHGGLGGSLPCSGRLLLCSAKSFMGMAWAGHFLGSGMSKGLLEDT